MSAGAAAAIRVPDLHRRVLHDFNQPGDVFRPGHGFVALDVQINIGCNRLRYFVHPLGAATVRGGGHLGLPAVALADIHNFIGVSGDDHVAGMQQRRGTNGFVNPANQEFPGNFAQRFARQPGGSQTCGDDGDGSHRFSLPIIYTSDPLSVVPPEMMEGRLARQAKAILRTGGDARPPCGLQPVHFPVTGG